MNTGNKIVSKAKIVVTFIKGEDIVDKTFNTESTTKISFENQCLVLSEQVKDGEEFTVFFIMPMMRLISLEVEEGK